MNAPANRATLPCRRSDTGSHGWWRSSFGFDQCLHCGVRREQLLSEKVVDRKTRFSRRQLYRRTRKQIDE